MGSYRSQVFCLTTFKYMLHIKLLYKLVQNPLQLVICLRSIVCCSIIALMLGRLQMDGD